MVDFLTFCPQIQNSFNSRILLSCVQTYVNLSHTAINKQHETRTETAPSLAQQHMPVIPALRRWKHESEMSLAAQKGLSQWQASVLKQESIHHGVQKSTPR